MITSAHGSDGANLGTGLGADVMSAAVLLTHSPQTSTVQSSRVQNHALSTWHMVWVWALKCPGLWMCQEIPMLPLLATGLYLRQVLASLTLSFQFLNPWEEVRIKVQRPLRLLWGSGGPMSEGSETPTRELACRPGQVQWWPRLSGVRWKPRHLTSLLCRKKDTDLRQMRWPSG